MAHRKITLGAPPTTTQPSWIFYAYSRALGGVISEKCIDWSAVTNSGVSIDRHAKKLRCIMGPLWTLLGPASFGP